MDEISGKDDWIDAYLEWTNSEGQAVGVCLPPGGRIAQAGAAAGVDFAAAYLEWMDAAQVARESGPGRRAGAFVAYAGGAGEMNELDVFREAALLVALRTESDCVRILRRILEAGDASPRAVTFAYEALQHAERLLEDERSAWRALSALRSCYSPLSMPAWRTDFETDWPHAIEDVAADVHALTGKVLALQPH